MKSRFPPPRMMAVLSVCNPVFRMQFSNTKTKTSPVSRPQCEIIVTSNGTEIHGEIERINID